MLKTIPAFTITAGKKHINIYINVRTQDLWILYSTLQWCNSVVARIRLVQPEHDEMVKKCSGVKDANVSYIVIILQQISCYLKTLGRLVRWSKTALRRCSNLHRGIISEEDALIEVTDIQHICLILGIDFFAASTVQMPNIWIIELNIEFV